MRNPTQFLAALLIACALRAQPAKVPLNFEALAEKAVDKLSISIDKDLITLALKFIPKDDPDSEKLRKVLSSLQGIYVKSFEFEQEGVYSSSDLEPIRKLITGTGWSCIVQTHNRRTGEDTDLCLRKDAERVLGLVVISTEPRKLTIVNILGAITAEELSLLQGQAGIPELNISSKPSKSKEKSDSKKKPDDDS